jgi:hypothetical protein
MLKIKLFLFLFFLSVKPAWAYLDPGSVSLWIQGILAAIAAIVSTSKFWWFRMKDFIKKLFTKSEKKE